SDQKGRSHMETREPNATQSRTILPRHAAGVSPQCPIRRLLTPSLAQAPSGPGLNLACKTVRVNHKGDSTRPGRSLPARPCLQGGKPPPESRSAARAVVAPPRERHLTHGCSRLTRLSRLPPSPHTFAAQS